MRQPDPMRKLRNEISEYMQQGLIMEDVKASAEECQERIYALGFKWDSDRMLWKRPERES